MSASRGEQRKGKANTAVSHLLQMIALKARMHVVNCARKKDIGGEEEFTCVGVQKTGWWYW